MRKCVGGGEKRCGERCRVRVWGEVWKMWIEGLLCKVR